MTIPSELQKAVEASVADLGQPQMVANHITLALGTVAEFGHGSYEDGEKIQRHIDVIFRSIVATSTE